ncbi:putative monooxygenase [Auricularia subglabra TFB-10046 SS5]|nr:putative monooxygenase [Auricularia subglabra TFB-10046 SS5]
MAAEYIPVICIGAGMGGICLGAQLQRRLGFTDFHIYEKLHEFGGTWCANTYPGCACDVPAVLYSFSFAQKPNWTGAFPPQGEILKYIVSVAESYGLRERTTFRTKCVRATWDDGRKRWRVHLLNLDTGETSVKECKVFITSVGILTEPVPASVTADFGAFKGPVFHSARWDHSVDLHGKDVVVIGNGCSANQIVPEVAPAVRSLTQIVRSAQWVRPVRASFKPPGPVARWAYANVPFAQWMLRLFLACLFEIGFLTFHKNALGKYLRDKNEEDTKAYVRETTPKEYHDILIPKFDIGCKRRVIDSSNYFASLNRENVHLHKTAVREILPNAVRTDAGTHPADVIVLATGFSLLDSYIPFPLIGRDGISIHQHWDSLGGPGAFDTVACAGFPNFLMILGPNTATGHTSTLIAIENIVNLILKLIPPLLDGRKETLEVKAKDEVEFVSGVQKALRARVWNGCHSWYKMDEGWNMGLYPWSQIHFWWRAAFPHWGAWVYSK